MSNAMLAKMSVKKFPFLNDQIYLERKVEWRVYVHRIKLCTCAECVQLTTNWSLAYNFLLTQLSRFSQNVLSWTKLFKMQIILCVSCVCSLIYVFYVCANFFCVWKSSFEVICSLLRILKSKLAAISWKKTEKNYFCFFVILFQTDLNKYTMKLIVFKKFGTHIGSTVNLRYM